MNVPLPREFYARNPLSVARDLIGKKLIRKTEEGMRLEGIIVETEAYGGSADPASHAFRGKTPRNSVMFGEPGHLYVYFTYGFHHCLNLVTGSFEGEAAGAVLIRAAQPLRGLEIMRKLRKTDDSTNLASGPGKLCQAFSIDLKLNGADATSRLSSIQIQEQDKIRVSPVVTSPRVGIRTARERPWRFYVQNSPFVSKKGRVLEVK